MHFIQILLIFNVVVGLCFMLILYYESFTNFISEYRQLNDATEKKKEADLKLSDYHVWLIFTKIGTNSPLKSKFKNLLSNLLNVTSVPLSFHVIVDDDSEKIATDQFAYFSSHIKIKLRYYFYKIKDVSQSIQDIVDVFTPYFSSKPGTYYSDALFYISLGLYRIAPVEQDYAVMLDCDLYFKDDIRFLFKEFDRFKPSALFGLAPELTPVYRHVLHKYRLKHDTTFGDYYKFNNLPNYTHPRGFQGYNSGVVLFNLKKIRDFSIYPTILSKPFVETLVKEYMFKGHLGDQDFYTLLGYEHPDLIQTLNCGFNRQLCTWWKDHGYNDVFDAYFKCKHKTIILHGNCNTKIPRT